MKNEFGVKDVKDFNGQKVVFVDGNTEFKGVKVKNLSSFGRRKFENLLVMNTHKKLGGVPKIRYE